MTGIAVNFSNWSCTAICIGFAFTGWEYEEGWLASFAPMDGETGPPRWGRPNNTVTKDKRGACFLIVSPHLWFWVQEDMAPGEFFAKLTPGIRAAFERRYLCEHTGTVEPDVHGDGPVPHSPVPLS